MTTIVLVRHGHTDLSLADYMCGTTDPPLCAAGVEMADAVAERVARERWVALYASPLLRTRQTAEPVGRRLGLPLRVESDLREIAYGEWEGRRLSEIRAADGERLRRWVERPGTTAPPGGESGAAVVARARPAVERILEKHPEGNVLVVSHKSTIRLLLCAWLGIDLDLYRARIAVPVASLSAVEFRDSGPLVTRLGDVSHLPAHLRETAGP
jgi:probable phosphoglycerate mutase